MDLTIRFRIALAIALTASSAVAIGATTTILPLREFDVTGTQGRVVIDIGAGQVDAPLGTFATTDLDPAQQGLFTLISTNESEYAPGNRRSKFHLLRAAPPSPSDNGFHYQYLPRALIAELLDGTSAGVALTVGVDRNDDGLPQPEEVVCQVVASAASPARCVLGEAVIGDPNVSYWAMASAPSGDVGAAYVAVLSDGLPQIGLPQDPAQLDSLTSLVLFNPQMFVTGPGHAKAGVPFPLRLSWSSYSTGRRLYGAALLGTGPIANLIDGATALVPFAFSRTFPIEAKSHPVFLGVGPEAEGGNLNFALAGHETQQRIFFDIPPSESGYPPLQVYTASFAPGLQVATDFYLVRADFPAPSSDPLVTPAPGRESAVASWSVTADGQGFSSGEIPHPASGRWYIVANNRTAITELFDVQIGGVINGVGRATPTIAPGQYYNPQRSGHGLSISRAAGQQLVIWYSYLDDGTPTWYIAQAAAPPADSGWWSAPLYRVSWDGGGRPQLVGRIEFTPTATNRFMFSWQLEGEQGSEAFELLAAADACVGVDNNPVALSGNWFAPAQSGYGVDVVTRADVQFDVVYFYDALGLARWGVGSSSPFAANSSLDMLQSSGFCPTCAFKSVTTQALGALTMTYASASAGELAMNFTLKAPLSGTWNIAQPMLRLTGSPACQ